MGKRNKKGLSDKVRNNRKVTAKPLTNPFEVKVNKVKHNVVNRKIQKGEKGLPGVSRSKALKKRKDTLLTELHHIRKSNTLHDRRFGERDSSMTADDKMVHRFALERKNQVHKTNAFNLSTEEEVLTHFGQSLGENLRDTIGSDSDDDDDRDRGQMKTGHLQFGGFSKEDGTSFKDKMKEVIADSKKQKYERQAEKEKALEATNGLDESWKSVVSSIKLANQYEPVKRRMSDFFQLSRALAMEKKTDGASDKLKTDEEKAKEESDRLQKLEEQRLARMRGDTKKPVSTHVSADSLSNMFDFSRKKSKVTFAEDEDKSDDGNESDEDDESEDDSESDEDEQSEDDDKASNADSGDDDHVEKAVSGDDDKDENAVIRDDEDGNTVIRDDDDNGNAVIRDDEDGSAASGDDEKDENAASEDDDKDVNAESEDDSKDVAANSGDDKGEGSSDAYSDLASEHSDDGDEDGDNDDVTLAKPSSDTKKSQVTTSTKVPESVVELPFVYQAPGSYEELKSLLHGHTAEEQMTIISRLRKCHHPSLAEGNKEKLENIHLFLLEYLGELAWQHHVDSKLLDFITVGLWEMGQMFTISTAKAMQQIIVGMQKHFADVAERRGGRGLFCSLDTLMNLNLIAILYPTSDFRHPVVTPAVVFITQMLSESSVRNYKDVVSGLFLCATILKYVSLSKRYVPEVVMFVHGVLFLASDSAAKTDNVVFPPFRLAGKETCSLEVQEICKSDVSQLSLFKLLKEDQANLNTDQFRCDAVSCCLDLLEQMMKLWQDLVCLDKIMKPVRQRLQTLPKGFYPCAVKVKIESLLVETEKAGQRKLKVMQQESKKPEPLRLFEPQVDSFWSGKRKKGGSDRTVNERQRLTHKYKREMKAAVREIKRDNEVLARHQLDTIMKKDAERKRKTKELLGDLAAQEGDYKAIKRAKLNKK